MGNYLSSYIPIIKSQYHVIYIQDIDSNFYPIKWPYTYEELLLCMQIQFDYIPLNNSLIVDDASDHLMNINSQSSFEALIPKYKEVVPRAEIYYICIDIPIKIIY